jgi:hypothetical protein
MSNMSQAAMAARIAELELQLAASDPNKVQVELNDGITDKGFRYCHLKIKGGPFGWRGVMVKRHWWSSLKQEETIKLIDDAFQQHSEVLDAYYASK